MSDFRDIMRMKPSGALALQERARSGDAGAARRFVLWSAWRTLKADRTIPAARRGRVFREIATRVRLNVIFSHG